MRDGQYLRARAHARDSGLRRLKRLTGAAAVATAALTGVFAGLAAQTSAARKLLPRQPAATTERVATGSSRGRSTRVPPPPPLPPVGSDSASTAAAAPAAPQPAPPPVQTQAPPVVVSGGS